MKEIRTFEFLKSISDAIDKMQSPVYFLNQLPKIIKNFLPIRKAIIFYKNQVGNNFYPFSDDFDCSKINELSEDSNLVESFATRKDSMLLENKKELYQDLFNRDSDNLLSSYDLNCILPLHSRNYYRGLLLAWYDPKKEKLLKDVEKTIQIASNIFIPVIETKILELEIDRNYYRLFKFDRLVLLGEMVASIAHELRTPINTVLLEIQEMSDSLFSLNDIDASYEKIKGEINRVNHFIESLLSFSRFKEISIEKISLKEFVEGALEDIPPKKVPQSLKISKELKDDLFVSTDSSRLRQVFLNVIFNAFDATGKGGTITIKTYSEYKETIKDIKKIISIRDNGPGIPQEIKERVLEPFFTTKKEGTGLGLYISYGIMKSLKGDLEIESNENGTTVFIILPGE